MHMQLSKTLKTIQFRLGYAKIRSTGKLNEKNIDRLFH